MKHVSIRRRTYSPNAEDRHRLDKDNYDVFLHAARPTE
eukprot:gene27080-biopygen17638